MTQPRPFADYIASSIGDTIAVFPGGGSGIPSWVLSGATVDMDFANGRYFGGTTASLLSITRASPATDLLPSSASGYVFNTYGNNVLAISPSIGLLIFESRTNLLLNSTAPATQTTASLGTGTYTLWVNGSGTALAAGATAVITGAATATNGSPNTFTVTVAGTVLVTVGGSLNFFQLEAGAFGTSGIVTAGTTATRATDTIVANGALLSSLSGASGTAIAQTSQVAAAIANNPRILGFTAPITFRNFLNFQSTGKIVQFNGSAAISTTNSVTPLALVKSGFAWTASTRAIAANGVTAVTDANAPNLAGNGTPQLGADNSGPMDGVMSRLTAWVSNLSPAVLTANTA